MFNKCDIENRLTLIYGKNNNFVLSIYDYMKESYLYFNSNRLEIKSDIIVKSIYFF